MENKLYPCPCCGFLVFGGPSGNYDICDICNWEDDYVQLQHLTMGGGANKKSLVESQLKILESIPPNVKVHGKFRRDQNWRPVTEKDLAKQSRNTLSDGTQYFHAAAEEFPKCYWQD